MLALNDDPVTIKRDRAGDRRPRVRRGLGAAAARRRRPGAQRWPSSASGPAGLAAAQQLTRAGHAVTVFERDDAPGGLLRFGIPDFKLEKRLVDRRLEQMRAEGTRFECGVDVGSGPRRRRAARAVRRGGAGHRRAAAPRRSTCPVATCDGVEPGDALPDRAQPRRCRAARAPAPISAAGRRVVVLGGGDTSADCLGCALREGAAEVNEVAHGAMPPRQRDPLADVAGVAAGAALTPGARGGRVAAMALRDRCVRGRRPRPSGARPGRQHDRRRSGAGRDRLLRRRARSGVRRASRSRSRTAACAARRTTCSRPATASSAPT